MAARITAEVLREHRSLSTLLPARLGKLAAQERGLAQELCFGVQRWAPRLQAIAGQLLDRSLKAKDSDIHALILIGLYQQLYLSIPRHAAVAETVAATRALRKDWARGLVNGVLRNFLRREEELLASVDEQATALHAHPLWLLERLQTAWPGQWAAVVTGNNQRPPMTLRSNRQHQDRDSYLNLLQEAGITASALSHSPDAITLDKPCGVERLPRFTEGAVSVQDEAAQLAAGLMQLEAGMRVLDACAAPGGKTCHMLERQPKLEMLALDSDPDRLKRVEENLARLRLKARCQAGDAAQPDAWWDGQPFDRILLDAPCSATGVIRRHPDIKQLRRAGDIEPLVHQQALILRALWPLLAPGGMLLYATCSILPEENSRQVSAFLEQQPNAREHPVAASWGHAQTAGRQILPGEDGMDGFYYACLFKE